MKLCFEQKSSVSLFDKSEESWISDGIGEALFLRNSLNDRDRRKVLSSDEYRFGKLISSALSFVAKVVLSVCDAIDDALNCQGSEDKITCVLVVLILFVEHWVNGNVEDNERSGNESLLPNWRLILSNHWTLQDSFLHWVKRLNLVHAFLEKIDFKFDVIESVKVNIGLNIDIKVVVANLFSSELSEAGLDRANTSESLKTSEEPEEALLEPVLRLLTSIEELASLGGTECRVPESNEALIVAVALLDHIAVCTHQKVDRVVSQSPRIFPYLTVGGRGGKQSQGERISFHF